MRRAVVLASFALTLLVLRPASAGVPTPHRLSFQGLARNAANQPVVSGDVRVRIYDAPAGGNLVYDSGSEFNGAIVTGVFNVLLGGGTPLLLDNTLQYHLELEVNGQEVIGDAASGRQAFWPAGGDASRSDLETRIQALEAAVFATCGPGVFDLNGNPADGCEFTLDSDGIYVDASDPAAVDDAACGLGPVGTGASCYPCLTITQGLARATALGRSRVHVANAVYPEAVTLVNGKSLLGGYRGGIWERDLTASTTILRGESASGNHRRAVVGTNLTNPSTLEGFVIFGPNVTGTGGNSYAVYLSNAGGLTMQSNVVYGGVGGPGGDGSTGPNGTNGVAGSPGANALQSPSAGCDLSLNRSGGAGGALTCAATSVNGGAGGGTRCTPVFDTEFSGLDGAAGIGGGGTAGDAGEDMKYALSGPTPVCFLPSSGVVDGTAGGNGASGANGSGGVGASAGSGSVVGGQWTPPSASAGVNGAFGRGGGGGGAGGGADDQTATNRDIVGATGGGGGSGACGGTSGGAGSAGGGSFGIFITTGSAPTISQNTIVRGQGGSGGRGGTAGSGGTGGTGGAGGSASVFCSGNGGKGGIGGNGGHGGGGGGGAGGITCGIFTSGIGAPGYASNAISGGAAGSGGAGGASLGNPGSAGASGSIGSVVSQ